MQGRTSPEQHITTAPGAIARPIAPAERGAVAALVHALDLLDPALGRRAALRAAVVARCAGRLSLDPATLAAALGGALLADVAALVCHRRPADDDSAAAVLGATVAERAGVSAATAAVIRHRTERWDGQGAPHGLCGAAIPLAVRVTAVAHLLVGPLEADGSPNWTGRAGRVRSLAGTVLDPTVAGAVIDAVLDEPILAATTSLDSAVTALDPLVDEPDPGSPIEALSSIGAAIHAAERIDDVLSLIAEHARRALRASTVSVAGTDHAGQVLRVLVNVGELADGEERFPVNQILALDTFPTFTAFATGEAHVITRSDSTFDQPEARYLAERGAVSEIAVPVAVEGRAWGFVWATSKRGRRELDQQDLATLRLVASQVAAGVTQATRLAELEELALRDPLTGLGNRRVVEAKLRKIFSRPPIARQDTAVIVCDVDGLKAINDSLGHAMGDAVLLEAADALRLAVAGLADAAVCRIGGDEFCIIIDGGGQLLAEPVAERAARLFARNHERSMSYGVAVATIDMAGPGDLLRAADESQYAQKRVRHPDLVAGEHAADRPGRRARRDH